MKVVIADDEPLARQRLRDLLADVPGVQLVAEAGDGREALHACAQHDPDVVLLDIAMPTMNGYEACRQMRLQPGGSAIVIIALTGWGTDDDRRRTREFGFNHHLTKPVNLATLRTILGSLTPHAR